MDQLEEQGVHFLFLLCGGLASGQEIARPDWQEVAHPTSCSPAGCRTEWDEIRCWRRAEVGQVVNVSCAEVSQLFSNNHGNGRGVA